MWHTWEKQEIHTKFWLEKPEENRALGKYRCSWEGGIKMDLREIGWEGVDLMQLAEDREQWQALVNTVMNLQVP
jgi:hypothetical protein